MTNMIAELVNGLTKPEQAILVKLADPMSNVKFLESHSKTNFQWTYFHDTAENILPLAKDDNCSLGEGQF